MIKVFELLSDREREVANLMLKGLSYKEIINELKISMSTVKCHIVNIFDKLECKRGKTDLFLMQIAELRGSDD